MRATAGAFVRPRGWLAALGLVLARARGRLFPWVPILMGMGVALWFGLAREPGLAAYGGAGAMIALAALARAGPWEGLHAPTMALAYVAAGFLAAGVRAERVETPRLEFRYDGAVTGRVVTVDRSQSDAPRVTLDRVLLDDVAPARTPGRVRISLQGDQVLMPAPGMVVMATAFLSAPEGPVEPGGFDFRRMAWFDGLGAVGYARVPLVLWAEAAPGEAAINRFRAHLRAGLEARIPGDPGAVAAALIVGDRAGISRETQQSFRDSSLAHLLAISGLHMSLLAGFIFGAVRYGLALVPVVGLRVPGKKVAAVAALVAGGSYLAISGMSVATERAFVMVAVMLVAVLFDRRAVTLRSVAMAAVVLLALQPEAMLEPGFQMSFAATVALVAGFGALRGRFGPQGMPGWVAPVYALFLSSVLAGMATAPYAAAHFNRIAEYGLLANMMAVPVMGAVIMPSAVVAGLLWPLGLEGGPLWVMEKGLVYVLWVSDFVAGLEGAVRVVPAPPAWVLGALTLGFAVAVLVPGRSRLIGALPVALAFGGWMMAARPPALITADAGLVGVLGPEGRALSMAKGATFAAAQWIENDGDLATQDVAALRPGMEGAAGMRRFVVGDWRGVHLKGRGAAARLAEACATADLVVLAGEGAAAPAPRGCLVIDEGVLRETGAVALWPVADGGLMLVPTEVQARTWTGRALPAAGVIYRKP